MSLEKILIIGGSGVVGSKLFNHLHLENYDVEFTFYKNSIPYANGIELDIRNKEETARIINSINPDIIVNTSFLNSIDKCESNPELAKKIMVDGINNIISASREIKSKICQISTSFVFDGIKETYSEENETSPPNQYGLMKIQSEKNLQNSSLKYLILRTDALYCWLEKWQEKERMNPVTRVLQTLGEGRILREVTDWKNTPTYVPDFVFATKLLLEDKKNGIYHINGSDFVNRFEWSKRIADVFNLDKKLIQPIHSRELELSAKRVNIHLSNKKFSSEYDSIFKIKGINEGLKDMKNYRRP